MTSLVLPKCFPFDDPSLPYRVGLMQVSDLRQVMDIERVAFSSPWPASGYRYELTQNDLSTYLALKLRQPVHSRRRGGVIPPSRKGEVIPPSRKGEVISPSRRGGVIPPGRRGEVISPSRRGEVLPPWRRAADTVLSYGGFWMILDEAHISTIAVHPKWRRRGLGEMMLVAMIEAAILRGAAEVTLEVRVSNLAAQNLYNKYAFVQVGRRKGYYTDNHEDALIMTTPRVDEAEFAERYAQLKDSLRQTLSQHLER